MATLTINTPSGQDARIAAAFGRRLGLKDGNGDPRSATAAEIKAHIIFLLTQLVLETEAAVARQAAEAAVTQVTPT